jgi:tetratricopeptide (TPR) repeat protein
MLTELARIQTYYSAILTNLESTEILQKALGNIDLAVSLDDTNSDAFAVHAFVNDWNASYAETNDEREAFLVQAEQSAQKALSLDVNNVLANVYRAEILGDQGRVTQAFQVIEEAVAANPNLMDAHRVYAFLYESTGSVNYRKAIEEYKLAAEIMPNFTYLYIKIGQNYRALPVPLYDLALEYFDRAATINEVLEIKDPLPYVAIAKTYSRQGEFFIAARNMQKALDFDPTNAQLYGELGIIYSQSRNFEGSIPIFRCAVEGCLAIENEEQEVAVIGLELQNSTVFFYSRYGSVLAALNECQKAEEILNQVGNAFSSDEIIMGIVEEGLFICR